MPRSSTFKSLGCRDSTVRLVKELMDNNGHSWDIAKLNSCLMPDDVDLVMAIPISSRCMKDKVV